MPASLRAKLRELDHETVKDACEEILASGNLTAKVSVVKFLSDLETYRADSEDSRLREYQAQVKTAAEEFDRKFAARKERMDAIRRKQLLEIFEPIGLGELVDLDDGQLVRELARRLATIPEAVRAEFSA